MAVAERLRSEQAFHDRQAWERTGIVGDRGDRTVNQMINGAVEHLAHHLRFVIEKRRALRID